ncbi:thioredoxin domain-containing protein isoform X2 [Octopus bimaculoides]|uniref:thioredoxin domain-containing protein isoform X2 n=1 Tax=Octopus bimaculoides TaxID=37653 RepID=UPI00071C4162|nr:thioredoxin domain-containing protein isoform X2 [Octopus bimaculoides]|eukprot:XP_014777902.1 PREDICTED: thioredoxin domain-containing protein-like isoform X2 [Octopus bimaculoides]
MATYLGWPTLLLAFSTLFRTIASREGLRIIEDVTPNSMHSFITSQHSLILIYCRYGKLQSQTFGDKYGVKVIPALVFFRQKSPIVYDGNTIDAGDVAEWLEAAQKEAMRVLNENNFEHLTQASTGATTGDWLVLFYKPGCGLIAMATMEAVAVRMHHTLNIAKVQMNSNPKLVERFKIKKCPSIIYFRHGKLFRYDPEQFDVKSMKVFVESWHRNVKAETVPIEPSAFDILTDYIVQKLKESDHHTKVYIILPTILLMSLTMLLLCVFCCRKQATYDKHKFH